MGRDLEKEETTPAYPPAHSQSGYKILVERETHKEEQGREHVGLCCVGLSCGVSDLSNNKQIR